MSSNKKKKKNKKLRREIEILRAQVSTQKAEESVSRPSKSISHSKSTSTSEGITVNDQLVKKDLAKTIMIAAVAFAIIIGLWIYNDRISEYYFGLMQS